MGSPGVGETAGEGGRAAPWPSRVRWWGWIAAAVAALAVLLVLWGVLLRTGANASVDGVVVECGAATGSGTDQCRDWGTAILAAGPGARVFEVEDVERIAIDRELFGLGDTCSVAWFIGRYPDRPALTEEVACR